MNPPNGTQTNYNEIVKKICDHVYPSHQQMYETCVVELDKIVSPSPTPSSVRPTTVAGMINTLGVNTVTTAQYQQGLQACLSQNGNVPNALAICDRVALGGIPAFPSQIPITYPTIPSSGQYPTSGSVVGAVQPHYNVASTTPAFPQPNRIR